MRLTLLSYFLRHYKPHDAIVPITVSDNFFSKQESVGRLGYCLHFRDRRISCHALCSQRCLANGDKSCYIVLYIHYIITSGDSVSTERLRATEKVKSHRWHDLSPCIASCWRSLRDGYASYIATWQLASRVLLGLQMLENQAASLLNNTYLVVSPIYSL